MHLKGREGNELGLTPVGYQFPDNKTDPWDSNQLRVAVRVATRQGTWEVSDPCLTTWEAKALANWLMRRTAMGALSNSSFTAPNMTIRARAILNGRGFLTIGRFNVSVELELEHRPPWATPAQGSRLHVELDVEGKDLLQSSKDLREELSRYPQRGDDPTL
ncbi:MAG: hypothetical protein M3Z84_05440 [Actinomycetota bacterium]|nr:hypothetical protein [Actinomycetota bacterium]